jgi:hypothetical protein
MAAISQSIEYAPLNVLAIIHLYSYPLSYDMIPDPMKYYSSLYHSLLSGI